MSAERFAYIWQYRIEPGARREFLAAYAAGGEWTRLFARDPAYVCTVLLKDEDDEDRYVTIDYWRTKGDRDAFRARYPEDFDNLDQKCEAFTREEQFMGDFLEVTARPR